jgi:hypothetical protein
MVKREGVHTMIHYVTIDSTADGFPAKCTCGGFNKKCSTRSEARTHSYLHLAGIDADLLELASAGKADHA